GRRSRAVHSALGQLRSARAAERAMRQHDQLANNGRVKMETEDEKTYRVVDAVGSTVNFIGSNVAGSNKRRREEAERLKQRWEQSRYFGVGLLRSVECDAQGKLPEQRRVK